MCACLILARCQPEVFIMPQDILSDLLFSWESHPTQPDSRRWQEKVLFSIPFNLRPPLIMVASHPATLQSCREASVAFQGIQSIEYAENLLSVLTAWIRSFVVTTGEKMQEGDLRKDKIDYSNTD